MPLMHDQSALHAQAPVAVDRAEELVGPGLERDGEALGMTGAKGEVLRMPFDAVARQPHRMIDGAVVDGSEGVDAGVQGKLRRCDLVLAEMERRGGGRLAFRPPSRRLSQSAADKIGVAVGLMG